MYIHSVTEGGVNGVSLSPRAPEVRVMLLDSLHDLPARVLVRPEALRKMHLYTALCRQEIGWLGTTLEQNGCIVIDDVFLFDQEVTEVTAEIDDQILHSFGHELLSRPDDSGVDLLNRLRVWGHSHVNMPTTPSGQDHAQMDQFAQNGHPYMLRVITNKRGEMRVDIYHFARGVALYDVPWDVDHSETAADIAAEIRDKVRVRTRDPQALRNWINRKIAEQKDAGPDAEAGVGVAVEIDGGEDSDGH